MYATKVAFDAGQSENVSFDSARDFDTHQSDCIIFDFDYTL